MKKHLLVWKVDALIDRSSVLFFKRTEVLPAGTKTTIIECENKDLQAFIKNSRNEVYAKVMEEYKDLGTRREEINYMPTLVQVLPL